IQTGCSTSDFVMNSVDRDIGNASRQADVSHAQRYSVVRILPRRAPMADEQLQAQLESLQQTLNDPDVTLSEEERSAVQALADNIEARLLVSEAGEEGVADPSLVDSVNLLIAEFSERHPTLAATLQNVVQSLSNIGICPHACPAAGRAGCPPCWRACRMLSGIPARVERRGLMSNPPRRRYRA